MEGFFEWQATKGGKQLSDPKGGPKPINAMAETVRSKPMSRIGLVTPLRDGMNLVAKEYVAAQAPDNPGVLVWQLSS